METCGKSYMSDVSIMRQQCLRMCVCITEREGTGRWRIVHYTFVHSFHCHVQNVMIPCHSQELLLFLSVIYPFLPPFSTKLDIHPPSLHRAIYFLVYLSASFPNSYVILLWEFYFLPFSVHTQTNIIYLTLLSLL